MCYTTSAHNKWMQRAHYYYYCYYYIDNLCQVSFLLLPLPLPSPLPLPLPSSSIALNYCCFYWMQRAKEANSMVCRPEFEIEICVRRRWRCVQLFTPSFYAHFLLARTQTLRHRYTLIKSHEQLQTGCQRKALWPFNDFLSPADWLKCVRFPLAPPSVAPFLFLYAFFIFATF